MTSNRSEELINKLSKGLEKSQGVFRSLAADEWDNPFLYEPEPWSMKDLIAHFIYSEEHLLMIAKDIASGREGVPDDFDIDSYNKIKLERMKDTSVEELIRALDETRETTIEWVKELDDETMDITGPHPALGNVNVETAIFSIYAHQLLHMRDALPVIGPKQSNK
ncbi:MAG: DinB family protein [Candidatus Hermodarchaeia archaeon]|jgi:hypothetical protein